ncbi:MAG: oligoendopeptidase F [Sphaerochaeta sp.]
MSIPVRSEQKVSDTWDLGSLFVDDQAWEAARLQLEERIKEASSFKGSLLAGKDSFIKTMRWYEQTGILLERIYSYAFLSWATDASNNEATQKYSLAREAYTRLGAAMAFFDVELLQIEEETINEYLADEAFADFAVYIKKARHLKDHVLSEAEERLLALQSNAGSTAQAVFSDLTNVDFDFGSVDGKPLSQSTFASFLMSGDRDLRMRAYQQFYGVYEEHKHTLGRLYEGQIKQDLFRMRARGYESARKMALFNDDVPLSVYDNLIKSVHASFPTLHRYYEIRRKALKVEKLAHWDVYVPLVEGVDTHTSYDQAVETISAALAPLGAEYVETLRAGLTEERWVDRYENKGKRSGAFSSGSFTGKPYILMNYKEDVLRDLFTLAHEGGHSMHSYYSSKNNPFFHYDYTIFEAEVASTFNEQLVAKYMIENATNVQIKANIISKQVDDIVATLYRQTMFAEFEMIIHQKAEEGEPITLALIREVYGDLQRLYFGPEVEFLPETNLEGLRIPHFYSPFYVYKYATGLSAAIALAKRVMEGGEEERNQYLAFLSSGGSKYPIETLKTAGVDMSTPKPVEEALQVFSSLLDQLEKLLGLA